MGIRRATTTQTAIFHAREKLFSLWKRSPFARSFAPFQPLEGRTSSTRHLRMSRRFHRLEAMSFSRHSTRRVLPRMQSLDVVPCVEQPLHLFGCPFPSLDFLGAELRLRRCLPMQTSLRCTRTRSRSITHELSHGQCLARKPF